MNCEPQTGNPKKEGERATLPPSFGDGFPALFASFLLTPKTLKNEHKKTTLFAPQKDAWRNGEPS